jgi:hypothetical protein
LRARGFLSRRAQLNAVLARHIGVWRGWHRASTE